MKDGHYRIDTSYNCQAALTKEQIMLSSEVITEASDNREDRRELLLQMRSRLQTKTGRKKYLQRLWTTELVFGHLKYNLGYRHFFLRSLKKVKGEFRLMCIGWNLKKMHKLMAFS